MNRVSRVLSSLVLPGVMVLAIGFLCTFSNLSWAQQGIGWPVLPDSTPPPVVKPSPTPSPSPVEVEPSPAPSPSPLNHGKKAKKGDGDDHGKKAKKGHDDDHGKKLAKKAKKGDDDDDDGKGKKKGHLIGKGHEKAKGKGHEKHED